MECKSKKKSENPKQVFKKTQLNKIQKKETRVVKLRRKKGIILQDCDVYIGRSCFRGGWKLKQSKWYNPFTIKKCGSAEKAVEKYREYIKNRPDLLASLDELEGKTLGCWCKERPTDPCRGDVLIELLKERKTENAEIEHDKEEKGE